MKSPTKTKPRTRARTSPDAARRALHRLLDMLSASELFAARRFLKKLRDDAEDRADAEAARKALAEGGKPIPWEQVKRDLGL